MSCADAETNSVKLTTKSDNILFIFFLFDLYDLISSSYYPMHASHNPLYSGVLGSPYVRGLDG